MRAVVLALVVLAAGGGAWWLLRDPAGGSGSAGATERVQEEPARGEELQAGPRLVAVPVPRGTLAIRGKVLRTNGNPATGARVTASLDAVGEVARSTASADGSYALEGLSATLHRVEARLVEGDVEYGTRGWCAAGIHDHDLTLGLQPRTIEFRILTPAGGPVPRFQARFVRQRGTTVLGARGEGRLRIHIGMVPGQDSLVDVAGSFLEVWSARDGNDRDLGLAPQRVGPLTGEEREVDVRLRAGPSIEGRVRGPDGPLGEAVGLSLSVAKAQSDGIPDVMELMEEMLPSELLGREKPPPPAFRPPFEGIQGEGKTDAEGAFRMAFLGSDAPHTLQASAPRGFLPPAPLQVKPGDPPVEIVLKRSVTARVTVLSPDGEPRLGARVQARAQKPWRGGSLRAVMAWAESASGTTDAAGVVELPGLDPEAEYRLTVEPQEPDWMRKVPESVRKHLPQGGGAKPDRAAPPAAKHEIETWRPADTTVRLERAHSVSGVVLDTADRPVEGATVSLRIGEAWESETSGVDGRFRFDDVAPGKGHVRASHGRGGEWEHVIVRLPEGVDAPPFPEPVRGDVQRSLEIVVAGDVSGLVLRVPATLTVTLRLAPPPQQGPPKITDLFAGFTEMSVSILHRDGDAWEPAGSEHFDFMEAMDPKKERRLDVRGLLPGHRYAAWMAPKDGRYVYAEFSADAGTVDLERREGGAVTGRVLGLPEGTPFARVSLTDGQGRDVGNVKTDREGRFEVRGLPPAVWTVSARHRTEGGPALRAEGKVSTGASLDLTLAPEKASSGAVLEDAVVEEVPEGFPIPR